MFDRLIGGIGREREGEGEKKIYTYSRRGLYIFRTNIHCTVER